MKAIWRSVDRQQSAEVSGRLTACNDTSTCMFGVTTANLGDPAPGKPKELVLTWTCGPGKPPITQTFPQNAAPELDCETK